MSWRLHERHAFVGVNGTGKSTVIEKLFKSYDLKTQRIVVIAETDPPAYEKYKRVKDYEDLKRFKNGVIKFYDYENNPYLMLSKLRELCNDGYLRNGLFVFEDCTNYVDSNPHRDVKSFIINHRMYDLDLIFTTHGLTLLPKFMRKFMHTITLFKTGEEFESERDLKSIGYMNSGALFSAYKEASEQYRKGNKHFHKTIATGL